MRHDSALFVALAVGAVARVAAAQAPALPGRTAPPKGGAEVDAQAPAIPADAPLRARAAALRAGAAAQRQARAYHQALANLLEAYELSPSPALLLELAATMRDMGRLADAANTYQRYVTDPATGAEPAAEVNKVKALLRHLDEQLTRLTIRVSPSGAAVSLDAGPFIPVGNSLSTRVRPGIHLVRVTDGTTTHEITLNGFAGERKDLSATLAPSGGPLPAGAPEHVEGWLITGARYSGAGGERRVRAGFSGPEIAAIVPHAAVKTETSVIRAPGAPLRPGVIAALRIDGEGRGAAGALGLVIARHHLEAELMLLRSDSTGAYVGARYHMFTSWARPYLALGVPGFAYDETNRMGETSTKLALGLRGAVGVELRVTHHLSVQGDIGYEHFFVDQDKTGIDANVLVPALGVIGRL
jgi:hypothetical protein